MPLAALGPILLGAAGTSAAATTAAWGAIGAGAMAGSSMYGAHKQASAVEDAAALQGSTADKTLAFQREQAALDAQRYEAAQQANYAQYVNRVKGAQALGSKYGFTSIPNAAPYVPTPMSATPQTAPSPFGPRAIGNYLPRS